jgi:hypothetical protein
MGAYALADMKSGQASERAEPASEEEWRRTRTIRVKAAAGDVFDFLADGTRSPSWLRWVSTAELGKYGGGVGATYLQSLRDVDLGGTRLCYRVVHHRRPVMLGLEAASLVLHPTATFRFSAEAPTTTTAALTVAVPAAIPGGADEAIARRWARLVLAALPEIKACLEAPPVPR